MKKVVSLVLTALLVTSILSFALKTAHSPQPEGQFVVDDYTLALWHLNEGEGQVVHDESIHHNDGTLGETSNVEDADPSWVNGCTGQPGDYALSFDDWYDYANVPDNPDGSLDVQLLDQFTIEFWTNFRQISRNDRGDGTHWNRFLGKGYIAFGPPDICGYGIYQCLGYHSLYAWFYDYGTENWQIECSPTPLLNTWVLISLVYDGNYARIYFNNVMQSEREVGRINFTDTTAPLTLGKWPGQDWPWADSIDGVIDEVRFSSIARIGRRASAFGMSVTWKWLDDYGNPFWLTANVSFAFNEPIENFNSEFNRSLGQITFNFSSSVAGFCNVTVPKLLMDGAFLVVVNGTEATSTLTWNKTHTFIYFSYYQGNQTIAIIGEIVTRIRAKDLLTLVDINGDGVVNILDISAVAIRFRWQEDD